MATTTATTTNVSLYVTNPTSATATIHSPFWYPYQYQQSAWQNAALCQLGQQEMNQGLTLDIDQQDMARVLAVERRRQARTVAATPKPAIDRARELLVSHLTAEQRETFERNRWFVVKGGKSGKLYRIRVGEFVAANIEVLDDRQGYLFEVERSVKITHRLCGHLHFHECPLPDHFLAQKLMLEHDEDEFLRIANRHAA